MSDVRRQKREDSAGYVFLAITRCFLANGNAAFGIPLRGICPRSLRRRTFGLRLDHAGFHTPQQRTSTTFLDTTGGSARLFACSVLPVVSRGAIGPVIDRVYPANEIRDAHERMESNANFGKIVLTFA
jgi:hypothetical protein